MNAEIHKKKNISSFITWVEKSEKSIPTSKFSWIFMKSTPSNLQPPTTSCFTRNLITFCYSLKSGKKSNSEKNHKCRPNTLKSSRKGCTEEGFAELKTVTAAAMWNYQKGVYRFLKNSVNLSFLGFFPHFFSCMLFLLNAIELIQTFPLKRYTHTHRNRWAFLNYFATRKYALYWPYHW